MDRSDFMPNLMCNVTTCGHNKNSLCCKDGIQVGGSQAFNVFLYFFCILD